MEKVYSMKTTMRQDHTEDDRGSELYVMSIYDTVVSNVKVSVTARASSMIMKTEVLIREPYMITMIMRLFSIAPIPQIVRSMMFTNKNESSE